MLKRAVVVLGALVMPLSVQAAVPDCPSVPAELAGWSKRVPAAGVLTVGQAADVALRPMAGVAFVVPPARRGAVDSHGGVVRFGVARAGTYRVAIGAGAWINVVRDGKAVASSAHGHGPACSGIAKMVDFKLVPGDYMLQLAGSAPATLPVLIVLRP